MKKIDIPPEVMRYFQLTGAEGGKARARRHSKAQLSEWGRKGGRPRKSRNKKGSKGDKQR